MASSQIDNHRCANAAAGPTTILSRGAFYGHGEKPMKRKRLQTYATDAITVTFDPNRCIHSTVCIREPGSDFDPSRLRWIRPEHAPLPRSQASSLQPFCDDNHRRVGFQEGR